MTIKLDGKPLIDFGIELLSPHIHPAAPQTRDITLEIPGRNGLYHFGSTLGPRNFSFECGIIRELDAETLQQRMRQFVAFLLDVYGKPREIRLTFDYEADKYYAVKFSGELVPERFFSVGSFVLSFVAYDPMAKYVVTSNLITMDAEIPIMSDLLWDTGLSNRTITAPTTFTVVNNGSLAIRFSYKVEGSGTNVTFAANGKSFSLGTFTGKTIEVDGEQYTVKVGGVNDLTMTGGEFIELLPGVNDVNVSGSGLNLAVSESLTYKYL
jgi:phage-related protein